MLESEAVEGYTRQKCAIWKQNLFLSRRGETDIFMFLELCKTLVADGLRPHQGLRCARRDRGSEPWGRERPD